MSRTPNEVSLSMPAIWFDVAVYGIIYGNIFRVTVESWQWTDNFPLYPKEQQTINTQHTHYSVVWKTTRINYNKGTSCVTKHISLKCDRRTYVSQLIIESMTYTISTVKRWLGPDRSVALTRNVSSILPLSNLTDSSLLSSLQSHVLSSWWGKCLGSDATSLNVNRWRSDCNITCGYYVLRIEM